MVKSNIMSYAFLKLNYEEVKNNFPATLKAVEDWYAQKADLINSINSLGAALGQRAAEKLAMSIIMFDPRKLYDVFDDLGCKIYITHHPDSDTAFCYYNSIEKTSKVAASRKEAEAAALLEAFEILNKNLADGQNEERIQASN
jgi:hypothetical protein